MTKVWERIAAGGDLDGLGLSKLDGRWHVEGMRAPADADLKHVVFKAIHFDRCTIRELRLHDARMDNCVFTACDLQQLRLWRTTFEQTRLCDVDLRRSAFGAVDDSGGHNTFRGVEFVRADLREIAMSAAEMTDCRFVDCNLHRVDFGGTRFERCTFSGLLDEVQFYAQEFGYEHLPRNEMKDISFADARFRYVEFRKLDMEDVVWPTAPDHVIVQNYRATLACMAKRLDALGTKPGSLASKRMTFLLRWAGDHQRVGVLPKESFPRPGEWELILQALAQCAHPN
jgi:uncharacterized protein YjbI with pentapeptide repeats